MAVTTHHCEPGTYRDRINSTLIWPQWGLVVHVLVWCDEGTRLQLIAT